MMTDKQEKLYNELWDKNAEKQTSLSKVINTTREAFSKDVLAKSWAEDIIGKDRTPARKHFLEVFNSLMPHYVLNGTDEVVVGELVKATDSNKFSKTIRQYRLSVDDEIVKPEVCINYIEISKEQQKKETKKVTLDSGYEVEVELDSFDAEGVAIMETVKEQYVMRKKSAWGYSKDVKKAMKKAIEIIDEELTAPKSAQENV